MFTLSPSGLLARRSIEADKYVGVDPTFVSRYLLQASVLEAYQMHQGIKKLKVLDVGGAGSIIAQFIDVDLTIIDVLPNKDKIANYIQGDALVMPFADKSFDVVISCDVLEHIPKDSRAAFLRESARVTKDLMIVAAPFNLEGVRDAETKANNFYKEMTGEDHRWLMEHLLDTLPDLKEAHNVLRGSNLHTSHFSHTALDYWQLVTRAGFLLAQQGHPRLVEHIHQLNKFYLEELMPSDFSETGYRTFLLASRQHEIDIKSEPDLFNPKLIPVFSLLTDAILPLL